MSITYAWRVIRVECLPSSEGEPDVLSVAHWTLTGTDGSLTGQAYGSVQIPSDPDAPFTPFADLTEPQVIGWVQAAFGAEQVTDYEAAVARQIADQLDPPIIAPPLPWDTP